jgi:hypothetical protein
MNSHSFTIDSFLICCGCNVKKNRLNTAPQKCLSLLSKKLINLFLKKAAAHCRHDSGCLLFLKNMNQE